MRHRFSVLAFFLLLCGAPELRSQSLGEFVLIARRTGAVEILDALTLQTVSRLHFDLHVERLSANPDGAALYVDGFESLPALFARSADFNPDGDSGGAKREPPTGFLRQFAGVPRWPLAIRAQKLSRTGSAHY